MGDDEIGAVVVTTGSDTLAAIQTGGVMGNAISALGAALRLSNSNNWSHRHRGRFVMGTLQA
jgi:hypothetical protein